MFTFSKSRCNSVPNRRACGVRTLALMALGAAVAPAAVSSAQCAWPAVQIPGTDGAINALAVYGNQLIAGGTFTTAGGGAASNIARWNGAAWTPLGAGTNGPVLSLCVYNNELYAGGNFNSAGGVVVSNIAKWNGAAWLDVGGGTVGPVEGMGVVSAKLIVGGHIVGAGVGGAVPASGVASWNGTAWSALGAGLAPSAKSFVIDNNQLTAGGEFDFVGPTGFHHVARWDGAAWQTMGPGLNMDVFSLVKFNSALFATGCFSDHRHAARWNGPTTNWVTVNGGFADFNSAMCSAVYGSDLYIGGNLTGAGGPPPTVGLWNIARWNGTTWNSLANDGVDDGVPVSALAVYNGDLYLGGGFHMVAGVGCNNIARWHCALGPGACCLSNGTCGQMTAAACAAAGGIYRGDGTVCGAYPCETPAPVPMPDADMDGLAVGNPPDCAAAAGAWQFPANYQAAALCEGLVGDYSIVATNTFNPPTAGNSLRMNITNNTASMHLTNILPSVIAEAPGRIVRVEFDVWVGAAGGGGSLYVGSDEGGGGYSNLTDRGPQLSWFADGSLQVNQLGVNSILVGAYPRSAWQHVRLDISMERDSYDIFWSSGAATALATNLYFRNPAGLDKIDRVSLAHFGATVGLDVSNSYYDKFVVTTFDPASTACYANCDNSVNPPVLTANDFQCFLNKFAQADPYANCDHSVAVPVLTANDFQCFLNAFAAGCP